MPEEPVRSVTTVLDGSPTNLPFAEAIAYFRQKLNLPTKDWKTIQGNENDWAFVVAGVTNADMLSDFRAAADRYIAEGADFNKFTKDFGAIAERYGWKPKQEIAWRAQLVAQTNLRQAYAAGQRQQRQNPAVKRLRPGLLWRHRDSVQFRPHHKALDGKVLDSNDPAIAALSGSCGYGCRCRLYSVSKPERGFDELSDRLPYTLPDGSKIEVPAVRVESKLYAIADPGFYYAPGATTTQERAGILQQMLQRQTPTLQRLIRKFLPARVLRSFLPRGFGK